MKTLKDLFSGTIEQQIQQTEHEETGQVTTSENSGSTGLVPIERLLPSVRISTNALVVHKQRQDLYNHILMSYCEAHRRVEQLQAHAMKTRDQAPQKLEDALQPATTLIRLIAKKHEIASLHSQDALETVRVQLGLDRLRETLLEELRGKLSSERGLKRLSIWIKEHLGKTCESIREINELFPHLTLAELSFFSLLEHVPRSMLFWGTSFDATSIARQYGIEEFKTNPRRRIPQQVWATPHGLVYALDDFQPETDDKGIMEDDVYQVLGFSGIRESTEVVEYNYGTKRIIQALVPLTISNARLYEKVWQTSPEVLQVGFGRIARLALMRTCGEEGEQAAHVALSLAIDSLDPEQRKRFEHERDCLEQTIIQASIYDLGRDTTLRADEVIRLIGILDVVPPCLVQEQPFVGFIQPQGASVVFIAPDAKIVEVCPLSPLHSREAVEAIHSEMDDAGRENRTIDNLMRDLVASQQSSIMDRFAEDEESLSLLETEALRLWIDRGIVLKMLPALSLVPVRDFRKHMREYTITGKDIIARMTAKIGLEEAKLIATTLQPLERPLLERVHRIEKAIAIHSIDVLMKGLIVSGSFHRTSGTITLNEIAEKLYGDLSGIEKAQRAFTLLHECGEAVWSTLDKKTRNQWRAISWPLTRNKKKEKHFLTFYAHHEDEKEDFCEHFAAYVLHGPEFRMIAFLAMPIQRKYRFLRSLVDTLTGSPHEYPRFLPWTISEIHGAIQQELNRMELEEALVCEELRIQDARDENLERINQIRKSFEDVLAQDERAATAEEIEDHTSRKSADVDEDEEEAFEEPLWTGCGFIEMHEIRYGVTEVLESVMNLEERRFHDLRDGVMQCLLNRDMAGVAKLLYFLNEDERRETIGLLREIEVGPQKPFLAL